MKLEQFLREEEGLRIFWMRLFYTPPVTWEALLAHCKRHCSQGAPSIRDDFCQHCSPMRSYLERGGICQWQR